MFMLQHSIIAWGLVVWLSFFGVFTLYERLPYDSTISLHYGVPELVHLSHDWGGHAIL
jgi:hypothetical protein